MKSRTIKSLFIFVALVFTLSLVSTYALAQEKININTAGIDELSKLEKIGPAYAKRIIEYREQNGPFKKTQDIMRVKGIGMKIYERIKDKITVEMPPS